MLLMLEISIFSKDFREKRTIALLFLELLKNMTYIEIKEFDVI